MNKSRAQLLVVVVGAVFMALVSSGAPAAAVSGSPDEQKLADMYAPVVVLREHTTPCGAGEAFVPVSVDSVLKSMDVVLRGPDGQVVKQAPTAADLAGKGEGYYLDIPGEPLSPGCDYETYFWATGEAAKPTLYSDVVKDPNHPDQLALQYWFFYVYNDWNDKHEGDWEMIQLLFNATTVQQALTQSPVSVAYAQHEGSEVADWNSPKLHKDGNHVAVYPGEGSHAAYYTQSHWFGKSAAAGFGCDNTSPNSVAIKPTVVVIPTDPAAQTGEFAWLNYTGRWGQKAPSFNNGPTGPTTKTQWSEPVTWQLNEGRTSATAVPIVAGPAANAFCAATTAGSMLFLKVLANPWLILGSLLALIAAIVLIWKSTKWKGTSSEPVAQKRLAGQIVDDSFGVFTHRIITLGLIGLFGLAALALTVWLQSLLLQPISTTDLTRVGAPRWDWLAIPSVLLSLLIVLPALGIVVSAVQHALASEAQGERINAFSAIGAAISRPAGAIAFLVMYVLVALCFAFVITIPVGLWLISRWAVASPAAVVEGTSARSGLSRSALLTKDHRWRTLATTIVLWLIAVVLGPLVGGVLLLLTSLDFVQTNWIAGILLAILVPIAATGLGLQYFDLVARSKSDA